MLHRSNAERTVMENQISTLFRQTPGHCWRSPPTHPVTHPKTAQGACELWVRSGLPGAIPCEQTANIDFANSIRPFDKTLWPLGSVFLSAASCNQCWGHRCG